VTPSVQETRYRFGRYEFDRVNRRLLLNGSAVDLPWRCIDALKLLLQAKGEVVDRQTLFSVLWPDTQVEESSLTKVMSQLRRTLSEGDPPVDYIETVPRIGYRLAVPAVLALPALPGAAPGPELVTAAPKPRPSRHPLRWVLAGLLVIGAVAGGAWQWSTSRQHAEAERLYQEAERLRRLGDQASISAAIAALRSAIVQRPDHAAYYAAMARTLADVYPTGEMDWAPMREAAERAVDLDPRCASCQATLGFILFTRGWEWDRAKRHLEEAMRLAGSNAGLHGYMAMFEASQQRLDQALVHAGEAVRIQPFFANGHYIRSNILLLQERYEDAAATASRSFAIQPKFGMALDTRAAAALQLGRELDALRDWCAFLSVRNPLELEAAHRAGGMKAALGMLMEQTSGENLRRHHAYRRARWQMFRGDKQGALEELEVALRYRHFNMVYAAADPAFKPLRAEPRFRALLRGMGLERSE